MGDGRDHDGSRMCRHLHRDRPTTLKPCSQAVGPDPAQGRAVAVAPVDWSAPVGDQASREGCPGQLPHPLRYMIQQLLYEAGLRDLLWLGVVRARRARMWSRYSWTATAQAANSIDPHPGRAPARVHQLRGVAGSAHAAARALARWRRNPLAVT